MSSRPTDDRATKRGLSAAPLLMMLATLMASGTPALAQPADAGSVELMGDVTVAYEMFGDAEAEPLVLIAGTGMQLSDWPLELVNGLVESGFKVIRLDNRDVGLSTGYAGAAVPSDEELTAAIEAGENPMPYDMSDMAGDVFGLLDSLGIESAHLVGISMGGVIAQWAALDEPDRVRSLTLIAADSGDVEQPLLADPEAFADVPPVPQDADDQEAFVEYQLQLAHALSGPAFTLDEEDVRDAARSYHERWFDPTALLRQQTAVAADFYLRGTERFQRLGEIEVPTVVVHGDADPLVPIESGRQLADRIPNAELLVVPGYGHDLPDELIPQLIEAIESVATRARQAE